MIFGKKHKTFVIQPSYDPNFSLKGFNFDYVIFDWVIFSRERMIFQIIKMIGLVKPDWKSVLKVR